MVDQLQERIEREARFTSDVNHELRSPLTTLANSLSVLEARRDELPPRALQALDLLGAEVRRFRRLVDELLEISRIDAKPDDISRDEVTIGSFVEHTVQATGTNVPTQFGPGVASQHILVDKRRFERIFANLFENAQRYAGGVTLLADRGSRGHGSLPHRGCRSRYRPRGARPDLRAVLAGIDRPAPWARRRHGSRAGHRRSAREPARRPRVGGGAPGWRITLRRRAPRLE